MSESLPGLSAMQMYARRKRSFAEKREIVKARRETERLRAAGYTFHETDWEIVRGAKYDWRIVEAIIDGSGKGVWTKIAPPPSPEIGEE